MGKRKSNSKVSNVPIFWSENEDAAKSDILDKLTAPDFQQDDTTPINNSTWSRQYTFAYIFGSIKPRINVSQFAIRDAVINFCDALFP